jgi:hypothetical protein
VRRQSNRERESVAIVVGEQLVASLRSASAHRGDEQPSGVNPTLTPNRPHHLGVFDLAGLLAAAVPPGVSFTIELPGATITVCRP